MIREWFELNEILGVAGLPKTVQGVTKKAKLENWNRRLIQGRKGKTFEYYVGDMPIAVQQALGLDVIKEGAVWQADEFEYIDDFAISGAQVRSRRFAFRGDWLKKMAINISHSTFFKMPDDTMERTIYRGDRALISIFFYKEDGKLKRGIESFEKLRMLQNGLYVVEINSRLTIRRLQFDLDNRLVISCDNPLYPSSRLSWDEVDPKMVIGQVRWYAHTINWD